MVYRSSQTAAKLSLGPIALLLVASLTGCKSAPIPVQNGGAKEEVHSATDPQSAPVDLEEQTPREVALPKAVASSLEVAGIKDPKAEIEAWCRDLRNQLDRLKWKLDPCPSSVNWKIGGLSVQNRALIYAEFGEPLASNSTLVFTMVHSDEVTPLYIGLSLAVWLASQSELLKDRRVIVAPLVNPDGFFRPRRTRVNSRGVDLNRNFATRDWNPKAIQEWRRKYRSDRRRFPGQKPESEPETVFQRDLIRELRPQKILSVHAPLSMMDYDGPATGLKLAKFLSDYSKEYLKLRNHLKDLHWQFYPGSLGNFAGRELGIPTMTLELPTADQARAAKYWELFVEGARAMIEFKVQDASTSVGVR